MVMKTKSRVRNIKVREDLDAMIVAIADHYEIEYSSVVHGILLDWQEREAKDSLSITKLASILAKSKKED